MQDGETFAHSNRLESSMIKQENDWRKERQRGRNTSEQERFEHAQRVWESHCWHLWPRLGLITMTKASKPSSNLASLVEGAQEWGGVLWGTMGAAFGGKLACGLMQRQAEILYNQVDWPFTDKAHKCLKGFLDGGRSKLFFSFFFFFFFTHSVHSLLFILWAWALKTNIWPSSRIHRELKSKRNNLGR